MLQHKNVYVWYQHTYHLYKRYIHSTGELMIMVEPWVSIKIYFDSAIVGEDVYTYLVPL